MQIIKYFLPIFAAFYMNFTRQFGLFEPASHIISKLHPLHAILITLLPSICIQQVSISAKYSPPYPHPAGDIMTNLVPSDLLGKNAKKSRSFIDTFPPYIFSIFQICQSDRLLPLITLVSKNTFHKRIHFVFIFPGWGSSFCVHCTIHTIFPI